MCIVNQTPEIHFHQTTTLTPQQFVAGLTDFGPGRSQLFSNSADEHLKVHHHGWLEADVTEGSGDIWERLHYDWSDPNRAVVTTIDSNVWGGASGQTYTCTRHTNGITDIDLFVVREGKNLKGRLLSIVLRTIGRTSWKERLKTPSKPSKPGMGSSRIMNLNHHLFLRRVGRHFSAPAPLRISHKGAKGEGQQYHVERRSGDHCAP